MFLPVKDVLTSVRGFWFRTDEGTDLDPDPHVEMWPYWDRYDDAVAGSTDYSHSITYLNGNFWSGIKKCCAGVWNSCGRVGTGGLDELSTFNVETACCLGDNPPWDWYLDVSGFTGDCAVLNGRHLLNYDVGLPNTVCGWDNSQYGSDPIGAALFFNLVTNQWQLAISSESPFLPGYWTSTTAPSYTSPSVFPNDAGVGFCDTQAPTLLLTPITHFEIPSCSVGCQLACEDGDDLITETGDSLNSEDDCHGDYLLTETGDSLVTENPKHIIAEYAETFDLLTESSLDIITESSEYVITEVRLDSWLLTELSLGILAENGDNISLDINLDVLLLCENGNYLLAETGDYLTDE